MGFPQQFAFIVWISKQVLNSKYEYLDLSIREKKSDTNTLKMMYT
jgi:hypothetical protein